jgi:stearoyl-CoA desaturase (delta-9 desaturase)
VKVHRAHHKYTDTEADPTNINRGLFFGYFSWYWLPPTPEAKKAMETVNLDDILNDKDVMFQYR